MTNHQLINQSSGETEWFTPQPVIEAARLVMGHIDLDVASSEAANKRVQADYYFDEELDGLKHEWFGCVWMNHPFHRGEKACLPGCAEQKCTKRGWHRLREMHSNAEWINKLVAEYEGTHVEQACCITFASTSEGWFQPLLHYAQCFLHPRTAYIMPDGTPKPGATKGSSVTYLGPNVDKFAEVFSQFGVVKIAVRNEVAA